MVIYLLLALVLIVIAVLFAAGNMTAVTIAFFSWSIQTNLAVALMVALVAGVVIALLFCMPGIIRNRIDLSGLKKRFSKLEAERDQYKQQAEESAKEVSTLEEQLASYSASLFEDQSSGDVSTPSTGDS